MNESQLQKKISKALNQEPDTYCVKIHGGPHQSRGLPDLVGCCMGYFFGIEVKMPGKETTLTPIQQSKLDKIERAGGISGVATTLKEARRIISKGINERIDS